MTEPSGSTAHQANGAKQKQEDEISLLDLLAALGRKKHIFLITVCLAVLFGVLRILVTPKTYTADTTLLPPQKQNSLSSMLSSQLGGLGAVASLAGGSLGLKNPNDMYVAMFRSRTVEDAMIRKYGLMKEYHAKLLSVARKDFESHTTVNGSTKDGLIHITVTDRNPKRAAQLANGYVAEFRDLSNHLAITSAGQRRMFYQQQMQRAQNNLTNAEATLEKTEEKSGMIEVSSQARALIQTGASLRAQIAAKEVEIQGMRSFATRNNPNLVQARQELKGLRAQLAQLAGKGGNPADELILPRGKIPSAGLKYLRQYRNVQYYQTIFDILAKQFEVAKLAEAREGALIQVVDRAIPPDYKSGPKRALMLAESLAAGIFLGVFLALAAAGWENLNQDPEKRAQMESVRAAFRLRRLKS